MFCFLVQVKYKYVLYYNKYQALQYMFLCVCVHMRAYTCLFLEVERLPSLLLLFMFVIVVDDGDDGD